MKTRNIISALAVAGTLFSGTNIATAQTKSETKPSERIIYPIEKIQENYRVALQKQVCGENPNCTINNIALTTDQFRLAPKGVTLIRDRGILLNNEKHIRVYLPQLSLDNTTLNTITTALELESKSRKQGNPPSENLYMGEAEKIVTKNQEALAADIATLGMVIVSGIGSLGMLFITRKPFTPQV
jgi:hypothetical protein